MPVAAASDNRGLIVGIEIFGDPFLGIPHHMTLHALALAIMGIETLRETQGGGGVVLQQELKRLHGGPQTACGIDPWSHAKADIRGLDGSGDIRHPAQSGQSGPAGAFHLPEAMAHKNPVLVHQRNDVGDCRQGNQVEILLQIETLNRASL